MKKIMMILLAIGLGVFITFFILNKKNIYAKEEYLVYAFQVGAFSNLDNANKLINKYNKGIVMYEDNLYKVYVGIYKDIDIVNKMLVYFEDKSIKIYLKSIKVNEYFYDNIDYYEKILKNSNDYNTYDKVTESILNYYVENSNEKDNKE